MDRPKIGPRVVALGGGHGLSATLRAAKRYAGAITAVVSVADDGGSSGRIVQSLGVPAPGDLRKCLVALAEDNSLLADSFEHRFGGGELAGHALGNLLIAGMTQECGSLIAALDEAARLVRARGRVLPATLGPTRLQAVSTRGDLLGQVAVATATDTIMRVALVGEVPPTPPEALKAISEAEQIIIGPGSLFTSVIAAILPTPICEAIDESSARVVYVANLREQLPETEGFTLADHVAALVAHGVSPDQILHDARGLPTGELGPQWRKRMYECSLRTSAGLHDEAQLANALQRLLVL